MRDELAGEILTHSLKIGRNHPMIQQKQKNKIRVLYDEYKTANNAK